MGLKCRFRVLATAIWLLVVGCAQANSLVLSATPFSASWRSQLDGYRCSVVQTIPHFGDLAFTQDPDGAIALEVVTPENQHQGKQTTLRATPPSWRADLESFAIPGISSIATDSTRRRFDNTASKAALEALRDGYELQISLQHGEPLKPIKLQIEALGFNALLADFDGCVEEQTALQLAAKEEEAKQLAAAAKHAEHMAKLEKLTKKEQSVPKMAALMEGEQAAEASSEMTMDEMEQMTDAAPMAVAPMAVAPIPVDPMQVEPVPVDPLHRTLENLPDHYRVPFAEGGLDLNNVSLDYLDQLLLRWERGGYPPAVELHAHSISDPEPSTNFYHAEARAEAVAEYLAKHAPDVELQIVTHGDTFNADVTPMERVDVVPSDLPNWE